MGIYTKVYINGMIGRIKSMSCNGCKILRKGCNDRCILRQSLQSIDTPQAQANATLFVANFFGRAALLSFLSSVPLSQRPALFQSLLFEACGRRVNPVTGAVGLLSTGNWQACHSAVETVLHGGTLPEFDNETAAALVPARMTSLSETATLDTPSAYPHQYYHQNIDNNINLRLFF